MVVADAGGAPATRQLSRLLVGHLRGLGIPVEACPGAASGSETPARVAVAVRGALGDGVGPPVLVLFGDESAQRRLVWAVALAGLLPAVRLVVHAAAARIPYEPSVADVFARAEIVVTESQLGAQAVRHCCAQAGEPAPKVVVLAPALPAAASLPGPEAADRRAIRRARMDVADDAVVVGCWSDDGPQEVAPLALRIFGLFARGHYLRCDTCGHVTPFPEDDELRPVPCGRCAGCGSTSAVVGRARDDARMVLLGEPASDDGLWTTAAIADHLGLAEVVVHEPMPDSPRELAKLWGCIDVHLQPHVLADVPASMRASYALGVPIVATGYGAVAERLTGAANLVPPRMVLDHSDGHRIALADPGSALVELCRLADDRAARRVAGTRLREVSRSCQEGAPLDRWVEVLGVADADPAETP